MMYVSVKASVIKNIDALRVLKMVWYSWTLRADSVGDTKYMKQCCSALDIVAYHISIILST